MEKATKNISLLIVITILIIIFVGYFLVFYSPFLSWLSYVTLYDNPSTNVDAQVVEKVIQQAQAVNMILLSWDTTQGRIYGHWSGSCSGYPECIKLSYEDYETDSSSGVSSHPSPFNVYYNAEGNKLTECYPADDNSTGPRCSKFFESLDKAEPDACYCL